MTDNKLMDERRAEVLRYDRWTCKLCEDFIDASISSTDDAKTRIMQDHIDVRHNQSFDIDQNMDKKYLVLYFTPYTGDIVQDNEKLV